MYIHIYIYIYMYPKYIPSISQGGGSVIFAISSSSRLQLVAAQHKDLPMCIPTKQCLP